MKNSANTTPQATAIGWVGTGVMGASMCHHLVDAGYTVTVNSRTRAKAEPLIASGATWAETPRQVAQCSELLFTMVGYPDEVRQVLLGADGIINACQPGSIIVDMTTSQPALAVQIAQQAEARQVFTLDAPVSGGDIGAREATLSIMVGGAAAAFEAVRPCFELMGRTIVHQGPAGSGQHTKMVNQILVASGMVGVCEALLYAHRAGLDPSIVLRSVSSGAAGSWALSNLAPRIISGDFAPGFYVEHFIKDMGIVLEEARRLKLALPGLALAQQLYIALEAQGHGRQGTQALICALSQLNGSPSPY